MSAALCFSKSFTVHFEITGVEQRHYCWEKNKQKTIKAVLGLGLFFNPLPETTKPIGRAHAKCANQIIKRLAKSSHPHMASRHVPPCTTELLLKPNVGRKKKIYCSASVCFL